MGAAIVVEMSKSKSFLRSSSGTSYPYPRTHTTLMVVPSSRPVGPEEQNTVKKQTTVRRPPLNRSIPPIPESKSNESIMSHTSRRSIAEKEDGSQPSDCVIIENRTAVQQLQRIPKSSTGIPRPSTAKKSSDSKGIHKPNRNSETPRSPLMTVARTVKNKFTKLTRMGRHEQDVSMKGSQSFSGIRQPKASIPKRVDQNANRVIKSSSMDVASTSQDTPVTSSSKHMVVIPQNPARLEDFSEEASLAEQSLQKENEDPVQKDVLVAQPATRILQVSSEPQQGVSMTLNADVLVITREVDTDSSTLPEWSESKRIVEVEERTIEGPEKVIICEKHETTVTTASERPPSASQDVLDQIDSGLARGQNHEEESPSDSPQDSLKTPKMSRKQHTFSLGEKIPDTSSELKAAAHEDTAEESKTGKDDENETFLPPKFIMTTKTPEAMRKHLAFVVSENEAQTPAVATSPKKKRKKIVKQRSMPETTRLGISPERYVMKIKTPEALRRHHTFTVRERPRSPDVPYIEEGEVTEPIATVGPTAEKRRRARSEDSRKFGKMAEEKSKLEKIAMSMKTPFTLRKIKTFMVEEKPKMEEIRTSKSDEPLVHAKVSFAQEIEEVVLENSAEAEGPQVVATPHTRRKYQTKSEPQDDKELTEGHEEHNERFILKTSTPLTMRKFQTFTIEDKKAAEQPVKFQTADNIDIIAKLEREAELNDEPPLKTSDMYVLTTMTPLPIRKEPPSESYLERIAREKSRSTSRSPEKGGLFVMGSKTLRNYQSVPDETPADRDAVKCAVVQPQRPDLNLESPKKDSQSDRAEHIERKASCSSGETSPEEEIPMDTHLTPTDEDKEDALIIRPIRRPPELTSPIAEEPEVSASVELQAHTITEDMDFKKAPVISKVESKLPIFRPPSPPKENYKPITYSKSTSPLKSRGTSEKIEVSSAPHEEKPKSTLNVRSKSEDRKEKKVNEKERERTKRGKRDERDKERQPKSPKMPITARSLRSAGKILTPSFFRKGESKIPKSYKTNSPQPATTMKPRMSLPFRNGRRAPLAEFESLVVEDSPAVENHPLTFEKWSNSPRGKRRHSAHVNGFSEPIVEEGDGNGNVGSGFVTSRVGCAMSPALPRHEPGLIDDEILDQPMLVGDTFSHSESLDCLSAVRRMEFEAEKATLISIDRSLIEDNDTLPRRTFDNNTTQSATTRAATVFTSPPIIYRKTLEDGLNEVEDIRSQLEKLQYLVSQEMRTPAMDEAKEALIRENEALRRELLEKDELISTLRQQIAAQHR